MPTPKINRRHLVEAASADELRQRLQQMMTTARERQQAAAAAAPPAPEPAAPAAAPAPAAPRAPRRQRAAGDRDVATNRIRHTRLPGRARAQMEPHQDHDLDVDQIIRRQAVNEAVMVGPLHYRYFNQRNINDFTQQDYMFSGSTAYTKRCITDGNKYFSYANHRYYLIGLYAVPREQGAGFRVGSINKCRLRRDDGLQCVASETLVMKLIRARRPIPPEFQAQFLRGLAHLVEPVHGGAEGMDETIDLNVAYERGLPGADAMIEEREFSDAEIESTANVLRQLDQAGRNFHFDDTSVSNNEMDEHYDELNDSGEPKTHDWESADRDLDQVMDVKDCMMEIMSEMKAVGCDDDVIKEHITTMFSKKVSETELNELFGTVTEIHSVISDLEKLAGLTEE